MHIIPAAGSASRIGGIPKYLLPIGLEAKPIVKFHIEMALSNELPVCIVVNPKILEYFLELIEKWKFTEVNVISANTQSMTETIQVALKYCKIMSETVSVSMPDTLTSEMLNSEYTCLSLLRDSGNALALWRIRPEQRGKLGEVEISIDETRVKKMVDKDPIANLDWSWGMFSLESNYLLNFDSTDSHPGISLSKLVDRGFFLKYVKQKGEYWDCGTPIEYSSVLEKSLIVH